MILFSFAALLSAVLRLYRPLLCDPVAGVPGLSESSDITPKSSVSLKGSGLVSLGVISTGFGDFGGAGGSTGLVRKASEDSTQSPTEDEMVAVQTEKTSSNSFSLYYMILFNIFL